MEKKDTLFPILVSVLFFILSACVVQYHELWIDESYHYLLAWDSPTLIELIRNGAITGHPVLWNICLFLLKPWLSVNTMQIFHCFISTCTVWLICRYAPFKKYEILLLVFGYYLFYEYTIIAKNYSLGFFFIFSTLVLFEKKKNILIIALLLGLASNLHLFILFVCVTLYIYFRVSALHAQKNRLSADLLMAVLLVIAAFQIIPSQSVISGYRGYDVPELVSLDRLGRSLGLISRGLLNIPDFRISSYWNSSLLFNISRWSVYLLSGILLGYIVYEFRKSRKIVLLYVIPLCLIMFFVYLAPLATGVRYWGFAYMMLVICSWLYYRKNLQTKHFSIFFIAVLVLQFIITMPAICFDLVRPFSNAKSVAGKIKTGGFGHLPIFVQNISQGPSLSAYIGKKVYFPGSQVFATYAYDKLQSLNDDDQFIAASVEGLKKLRVDSCLLAFKKSIDFPNVKSMLKDQDLKFLFADSTAVVSSENYFIYLLSERP